MRDDLAGLRADELREALSLLGLGQPSELPSGRSGAGRALRRALAEPGFVRSKMADAPAGAAEAFERLVRSGPQSVEALLGRGWWGRGLLPPPLDWLQRRAVVIVDSAGLVRATAAARRGWDDRQLTEVAAGTDDSSGPPDAHAAASGADTDAAEDGDRVEQPRLRLVTPTDDDLGDDDRKDYDRNDHDDRSDPVVVEAAGSVVISRSRSELDRALGIPAAGLRAVAPTVAISKLRKAALEEALRAGGVRLRGDQEVSAHPTAPALPGNAERAVTPWDIRAVFRRAIDEGRQIHLLYYPSSRGGAATERTVDPWNFADDLLVGWCHLRSGERTFALDRVGSATLLGSPQQHGPA